MVIFRKKKQQTMRRDHFDRRVAHDRWFYLSKILAVLSWLLFIIALVLSHFAAPDDNFAYLRYHGIAIRQFWLTPLTGYLYLVLWFSAFCSYFYLIVAKVRSRRNTDNNYFNIVLLLIITLAWAVYILVHVF